ncbi:MAG: diguanylate cyclase [Pseudomonadota bacterium]
MSSSKISRRLVVALTLALGAAFFFAAYRSIDNIVAEQSRVQQQSVSPVYKLVRDELLRPLYIAETFASTVDFAAELETENVDEAALLKRLADMERDLGLTFFVASELSRKQYFSDGRVLDLVEGQVAWYFEARERDLDFMADLGQVGDVHLYFDVKVYGGDRQFLGYVGVGKHIQRFIDRFEQYKSQYGYDFLFVNDRQEIILSSLPELVVTDAYIPTLDSLGWFEHGDAIEASHDSEIIQFNNNDSLISEFQIEELVWRLLLLTPLEARQAQTTQSFVISALTALVSVLLLGATVFYLLRLYRGYVEEQTEIDVLTGLPNRTFIQRYYDNLQRDGVSVCAVIIDLDHFKSINDTYGHDAGDRVLMAAADVFRNELRDNDTVGRWGGEEFVMLLPATPVERGVAIAERTRRSLERLNIELREATVSITASFGVAAGPARNETLADLLARADKVLYEAKEMGRNCVRLYKEAS